MGKKSNVNENRTIDGDAIPDDAIKALARVLYPAMVAYFESEEGQREFEEWRAAKERIGQDGEVLTEGKGEKVGKPNKKPRQTV